MAAPAGTILKDWEETLRQWLYAMDHAPGLDMPVFDYDDWRELRTVLVGAHGLVSELARKYAWQRGKSVEEIAAEVRKRYV